MRRVGTPDSNKILPIDGRSNMEVAFAQWKNLVGLVQSSSKTDGTRKGLIISPIVVKDM